MTQIIRDSAINRITIADPPLNVSSLNGETGAITITSANGSVIITEPSLQVINLEIGTLTAADTDYVSGAFPISTAASVYVVDTSGGAATGQLPPASDGTKKYDMVITSNANTCRVNPDGADTINEIYTFATIRGPNTGGTFQSDGISNWTIVAGG